MRNFKNKFYFNFWKQLKLNFTMSEIENNEIPFGRSLKHSDFLLGENFTNLNHGSFGAIPKRVFAAQNQLILQQGRSYMSFFDEFFYE